MEAEPDTTNIVYLDEHRKFRWLRVLEEARQIGAVATFNFEYAEPATVLPFPIPEQRTPDGAA